MQTEVQDKRVSRETGTSQHFHARRRDSLQCEVNAYHLSLFQSSSMLFNSLIPDVPLLEYCEHFKMKVSCLNKTKQMLLKIEDLIANYERLPVCYNQIMLQGTLRYCSRALQKIDKEEWRYPDILSRIEEFTNLARKLFDEVSQDEGTKFIHLNLRFFETRFDLIETSCKELGLLPPLENIDVMLAKPN